MSNPAQFLAPNWIFCTPHGSGSAYPDQPLLDQEMADKVTCFAGSERERTAWTAAIHLSDEARVLNYGSPKLAEGWLAYLEEIPASVSPRRPYVVIYSRPTSKSKFNSRDKARALRAVLDWCARREYSAVIQPHPKESEEKLSRLLEKIAKARRASGKQLSVFVGRSLSPQVIRSSSFCVSFSTSIPAEAVTIGSPVLVYRSRKSRKHWVWGLFSWTSYFKLCPAEFAGYALSASNSYRARARMSFLDKHRELVLRRQQSSLVSNLGDSTFADRRVYEEILSRILK